MAGSKKTGGLAGVSAGTTALCTVGQEGAGLTYRGYDIYDLADNASFEEVAYLLLKGKPPNRSELDSYVETLKALRGLPDQVRQVLEMTPAETHPTMDGFVVVSTPQDLANLDAKRCINMIRKLNLNVLGVVENYTGEIFGEGGGKKLAKEVEAPFLADIALRSIYRDSSKPTTLLDKSVEKEFATVADAIILTPRKTNSNPN